MEAAACSSKTVYNQKSISTFGNVWSISCTPWGYMYYGSEPLNQTCVVRV
jgi:hypothetical protein